MGKRFQERFGRVPDHNGFKGYIGAHLIKAAAERVGALDQAKIRDCLHNNLFTAADEPGLLMDTYVDEKGDADRPSFIVEVKEPEVAGGEGPSPAGRTLHQAGLPLAGLGSRPAPARDRSAAAPGSRLALSRGSTLRRPPFAPRPRRGGPRASPASAARAPDVTDFLQLLVAGVSIGSIYAMTAIGFVLLWQTSNTINFAQGEFVVLPAFAMVLFWVILKLPFGVALLATVLVSTLLLGFGVRKLLVARLLQAGVLPLVIATIGLSLLIRYSLQQFWTPLALPFPALFPRVPMQLGTVLLAWEEIMNVVFAGAVIGALQLFITRTKLGWAMQAVAQNRTLASVLGIDVGRLVTITFVLNAALTALAAILIAPVYLVKYDIGIGLGLKAFYAAIIGGFNQMRGALLGGLLVGIVETLSAAYISGQFRDAAVLAILVAVLLWKPEGLWGVKEEWAS